MGPAVTVIVPIYNTEKYVKKCLESIMSQSLPDIEILCIDDCSTDHSVEIVKSLEARDSRIKLVRHQSNLGLGGARNTGIQLATAPYIAGVDSDDYISSTMIEKSCHAAVEGNYDIIVFGWSKVDEHGNKLETIYLPRQKLINLQELPRNIFSLISPGFWNKLWKKSLFLDNKIFFPNHLYYEDLATTPRILLKARTIYFISEDCYRHCNRSESITNTHSAKHTLDYLRVFDIIKDFLINEGVFEMHREDFESLIRRHFSYHAETIRDRFFNHAKNVSKIERKEIHQYLRYLLLLREAYVKFDDDIRKLSIDELCSHKTPPT